MPLPRYACHAMPSAITNIATIFGSGRWELSDGNATAMRPSVATAMRPSVATVAGIGLVSLQAAGAAFQGAATLPARVAGHLPAGLPLSQDE